MSWLVARLARGAHTLNRVAPGRKKRSLVVPRIWCIPRRRSSGRACSSSTPNNHAPEWDRLHTEVKATGSAEHSIHFTVRANDADNDPVTYSLSGLPKRRARPSLRRGAIDGDPGRRPRTTIGVYRVTATATDGKSKLTERQIKVIVEDEHESFFMPDAAAASLWVPGSTCALRRLHRLPASSSSACAGCT